MCDTLCVPGARGMLFAKNSDRPVTEPQVVEAHPRRRSGGSLRAQYLELPDEGAAATVLSRPTWLWGAEHGVNEHGVAIGNELVNTVDDPAGAAPALLGMDLVRLGLERSRHAEEALEVMTGLLGALRPGRRGRRGPRVGLLVLLPDRRPELGLGARDLGPHVGRPWRR